MSLDKAKIEEALLEKGLSTKKSKALADYLSKKNLEQEKKAKVKKGTVTEVDLTEVKKNIKEEDK